MSTFQEDVQKSATQLAESQKEILKQEALHDFFRSPIGLRYSSCQANIRLFESY